MIIMTPEVRRESEQLRKEIARLLAGHNPAAAADVLITLLAQLIAHNATNPQAMAVALAHNLALSVGDDDDKPGEPLPN